MKAGLGVKRLRWTLVCEQARASARGVLLRVNSLAINGELANRPSEPRENARLLSRSALA